MSADSWTPAVFSRVEDRRISHSRRSSQRKRHSGFQRVSSSARVMPLLTETAKELRCDSLSPALLQVLACSVVSFDCDHMPPFSMVLTLHSFGNPFSGLTLHTREVKNEMLLFVTCQLSAVGVGLGAGRCVEVCVWLSLHVVLWNGGWEGGGEENRRSPREREECLRASSPW